jgi:alkanesulfonate monooxygenase SsuD/methylene tetrahydromethanopterin reductase-like flavin-dependent oxidoreductase (luciferase family)
MDDAAANARTLILAQERVDQLRNRFEELVRRVERNERSVQEFSVLPVQVTAIREDIAEIKHAIESLAVKMTDREQWLESFRLQAASVAEGKHQNIKTGLITVIVLGSGVLTTLLGILANALMRAH